MAWITQQKSFAPEGKKINFDDKANKITWKKCCVKGCFNSTPDDICRYCNDCFQQIILLTKN